VYTLAQAAKATGLTKAAIQKSIKKGRVSAHRNDFGHYAIDPAELHRVYPVVDNRAVESKREETAVHRQVITSEQVRIKELETQLAMKDQLFEMKDQLLEQVKAERDHWRQQATYLLESRKESWLSKLFGRKA
jgi:hypothetical protein